MQLTSQGPEHRYAKALFELAEQSDTSYLDAASEILSALASSDELLEVLSNKAVSGKEKKAVLSELLKKVKADGVFTNFISLVCDKGRTEYLEMILGWYVHLERQKNNVVEAKVISAKALSAEQCQEVQAFVRSHIEESTDVVLEKEVDASLVAGLKVLVDSKEFDMSVRGRFDGLRTALKLANN